MAWLGADAVAVLTSDLRVEHDLAFQSEGGVGEVQIQPYGDVSAPLRASSCPAESTPETTESSAEELLEDVLESAELAEEILTAERLTAIVPRPLLRIRKHLVGFSDLSEAVLCLRITRIGIGMGIARQRSKCLLDLVL
jgi:hypothetical protein